MRADEESLEAFSLARNGIASSRAAVQLLAAGTIEAMARRLRRSSSPAPEMVAKRPKTMDLDQVKVVFDSPFEDFEFEDRDLEWIDSMGLTKLAKIMRSGMGVNEWRGVCMSFIRSFRAVDASGLRYRATIRAGQQTHDIDIDVKKIAESFQLPHVPGGMHLGGIREAQWKDGFDIFERSEFTYSMKKGWCLKNLKPAYMYMKKRFDLLRRMIWFNKQSSYIGNVQARTIFEICTMKDARQPDWATGFLKSFVYEIERIRKLTGPDAQNIIRGYQIHTLVGPAIRQLIRLQILFEEKENVPPKTDENVGKRVVSLSGVTICRGAPVAADVLRDTMSSRQSSFVHSCPQQASENLVQQTTSNIEQQELSIPAEVEDEREPMSFEADDMAIPGLDDYLSSESGGKSSTTSVGKSLFRTSDGNFTAENGKNPKTCKNLIDDHDICTHENSKSQNINLLSSRVWSQESHKLNKEVIALSCDKDGPMQDQNMRDDFIRGVQFVTRRIDSVGGILLGSAHMDQYGDYVKYALKALNYFFRVYRNYNNPTIETEDLDIDRDVPGDILWEILVSLTSKVLGYQGSKAVAELSWHLIRHATKTNFMKIAADPRALCIILECLTGKFSCTISKIYAVKSLKMLVKQYDCAETILKFPGIPEGLAMLTRTDEEKRLHSKVITLLASLIDLSSGTCDLVVRLPSFWDVLSDNIFMARFDLGPVLRLIHSISRASHQCRVILGTLPGITEFLIYSGSDQPLTLEILSSLLATEEYRAVLVAFPNVVEKLMNLLSEANNTRILFPLVHSITLLDTEKTCDIQYSDAVAAHYGNFGRGCALLQQKFYQSAVSELEKASKAESLYGFPLVQEKANLCRAFAKAMLRDLDGALTSLEMMNPKMMEFSLDWEKSVVLCLRCEFKRALAASENMVLEGEWSDTQFKRDRNYWKHRAYVHFLVGDEVQCQKDVEEALKARQTARYDPEYWSCPQLLRLPLEYMALAHVTTLLLSSVGTQAAGPGTIMDKTARTSWGSSDEFPHLEKLAPCLLRISNYTSLSDAVFNHSLEVPDSDIRSLSVAHLREMKCIIPSSWEEILGVSVCRDPTHICSVLASLDNDTKQENGGVLCDTKSRSNKKGSPVEIVRQELATSGGGRGLSIILKSMGMTLPGKLANTEDSIIESELFVILEDFVTILNEDPDIYPHIHSQVLRSLTHLIDRQFRTGLSMEEHIQYNRNLIQHFSNCLDRVVELSNFDKNHLVQNSAEELLSKLSNYVRGQK